MGGTKPIGAPGMTQMTIKMGLLCPGATTGAAPGPQPHAAPVWDGRSIATHQLCIVNCCKFSLLILLTVGKILSFHTAGSTVESINP